MQYPSFFDKVPPVELQDTLSDFLGVFVEGKFSISYLDCVKLAGHSCPTVAGAYLVTMKGLKELYGEDLPQRGEIEITINGSKDDGVNGIFGTIISFIVGAGDSGGFKGIQGNFSRNNLLAYTFLNEGIVKFTRVDTKQSVTLTYDPSSIKPHPQMKELMQKSIKGLANNEEKILFGKLWQERVEKILLSNDLHQNIITILKD